MTSNEPFYALIKAYRAKFYRALEARKKHEKCARYFQNIVVFNKKKMDEYGNMIMLDKKNIISDFWNMVESK